MWASFARIRLDEVAGQVPPASRPTVATGARVAQISRMNEQRPETMSDLAKGIAVRAGVLSLVSVIVGAWVFSLAAKAASGIVKVLTALFVLTVGAGVVTWQVKKVQKHRGASEPTL
jgi:cobalamin biosynthesis protein CobD/CbiB